MMKKMLENEWKIKKWEKINNELNVFLLFFVQLESDICRKEYAIANGHAVLKEFTPDCGRLPMEPSIEHRKCIRLGLRPSVAAKQAKLTKDECYTGDGRTYAGMHRQTVSGGECRKWDGVKYPDLAHHNYCRNPDSDGHHQRPWCINDAQTPWNLVVYQNAVRGIFNQKMQSEIFLHPKTENQCVNL